MASRDSHGTHDAIEYWKGRTAYLETRLKKEPPPEPEACYWTPRDLEQLQALAAQVQTEEGRALAQALEARVSAVFKRYGGRRAS